MLKTFKMGGVHPPEMKIAGNREIKVMPIPGKVFIPLNQHLGVPAMPVVKKGDEVKTGQLIARSAAFISANIHAPVSGKIVSLEDITDHSGYRKPGMVIEVAGDVWDESIDRDTGLKDTIVLSQEEIIQKIAEMGIVGLGGATFPTHIKMMVPKGKKADVLIINGVECEPYLTSDHRLMLEKGEEIIVGTRILMKALGVNRAIIGIENNKPDAIVHLTTLVKNLDGIEVAALKVKYPQGGEKQLIKALTGREVPSGKLPIEVGCVVDNIGTAFAVYEAVQKNKPLIERIVTVTGPEIDHPANYLVRIGTPVSDLIKQSAIPEEKIGKLISGGPMMGKSLNSMDVPVTKGTSGILVIPEYQASRVPARVCIRCGRCISVCPMGLEPYLLSALAYNTNWEQLETEKIMDCMECGSCHYTCPSGRPLLDYIRLGKSRTGQIIRSRINKS